MKKKVIILGSTGSVGKNTLEVLKKNKKEFEIVCLSTNKNINIIYKQIKEFNVKNVIIIDKKKYILAKKKFSSRKLNIFNNFESLDKILLKKKVYYSMISISGLDGLRPTLQLIKYTKNLAVVNKESLICGWNLIQKSLNKYKTNFIPIDSEHFSIFSLIKNHRIEDLERIFITASGGPFLDYPKKKFNHIKPADALKHPNWNMGKKITIDSATLMNKVFEVIEAKNIFNINYSKISILTHPKSYIHAIVKFKSGLSKILIHEPDMKIPIYNSFNFSKSNTYKSLPLNLKVMNNLNLKKVDSSKFPLVKILNNLPKNTSLFETILVTINDKLVYKFLEKKISFNKLVKSIYKFSKFKKFQKFKKIKPKNVTDIYRLRDYVSLKIDTFSI